MKLAILTILQVDNDYVDQALGDGGVNMDQAPGDGGVNVNQALGDGGVNVEDQSPDNDGMKERVKELLRGLVEDEKGGLTEQLQYVDKERLVVELEQILQLFEKNCMEKGCIGACRIAGSKLEGGVLVVNWKCSEGHSGKWASSSIFGYRNNQPLYSVSTLLAVGVLISGNNFEKMKQFADFLNLHFVSQTTNYRVQSFFALPVVREFWSKMQGRLVDLYKDVGVVLCGDARNDSPGHSAKYCVYTLMEHCLNVILDLEVVDVRQTKGSSTNMETFALRKLLERNMTKLQIKELVTDASRSVGALVNELKGKSYSYTNL